MSDSPHNHALSPSSDLSSDPGMEEANATVTFLPPVVSRIFMGAWILLFAVRWLIVQGLITVGFFGSDLPQNLDRIDKMERIDTAMGRCYLLLLSVTLVTLVVRTVQGRKSQPELIGPKMDFNAQEVSAPAMEDAVEADTSDRGGKQA